MISDLIKTFNSFHDHYRAGDANAFKPFTFRGIVDWHKHDDADESFRVQKGEMIVDLREHQVTLQPGHIFFIPRGTEHRTIAETECEILLFQPEK